MRREFCMLAHKYEPKVPIGGWWASEKLDGMRFNWDGGLTRGLVKSSVPWANCAKDSRYVDTQYATGLWSRYGNVIHAPDWFLDKLPLVPCDGELYTRAVNRQAIFSTIKDLVPSEDWRYIQAYIFDLLPLEVWLMDGEIKNTGFKKSLNGCYQWAMARHYKFSYVCPPMVQFETIVPLMQQKIVENDVVKIHPQLKLSLSDAEAVREMTMMAAPIVAAGGEGLMLRSNASVWEFKRSHRLLKFKPTDDMEGVVIGYITGRETALGSKLLGMMGALVLRLENGKELELSGFTDAERELSGLGRPDAEAVEWASQNPEGRCPDWIEARFFPRGTKVQFKYRGLSDYGVPQEARYARVRNED
jgi:DNA ligase-1